MTAHASADGAAIRRSWAIWLVWAGFMILTGWQGIMGLVTSDPDDALRMVQVRDLLAGQAWWDVSQHRINPFGGGGLMHWSRIVDAPLAGGVALLTPLVGMDLAERIVFASWPPLLAAPLFPMLARMCLSLGDRAAAAWAPLLLALSMTILYQFSPLRIDHHGWQILLSGLLLLLLLRPASGGGGWAMGAGAAALLAISLEGLPVAVLIAALLGAEWLWQGDRAARARLIAYLAALGSVAALLQWATRGPDALLQSWCDALSLPWLAALTVAAVLVAILAPLASPGDSHGVQARAMRAGALLLAALASGATLLAIDPACARGPFAGLDPLVVTYWYSGVREGLPLWHRFDVLIGYSLAPTLIGLFATLYAGSRAPAEARRGWLLLGGAAAGAIILSLLVLRSMYVAHLFLLPGTAALFAMLWRWGRDRKGVIARLGAVLPLILLLPPISVLAAVRAIDTLDRPDQTDDTPAATGMCVDAAGVAALTRLRPALILAPLDIGPHLLQRTRHSVVATGHHRNDRAMAATILAFVGDTRAAEARARGLGATIIVTCPAAPEWQKFARAPGNTLARRLSAGDVPTWLEPLDLGASRLKAWRVRPAGSERPARAG